MLEFSSQVDHSLSNWSSPRVPAPNDANPNTTKGSGFRNSVNRAMFYTQCPFKTSYVAHTTNYTAGHDFSVKIQWIQTLWDQQKLDRPEDAAAFFHCLTPSFSAVVRLSTNRKRALALQDALDERETRLRESYRPWRSYPVVTAWMAQMAELAGSYSMLWIHGPPNLAKSPFAASLYDRPCIFEGLPNWTMYDPEHHNCIIFDDTPGIESYIMDHKRIFQSASRCCNVNCTAGMTCALQIMTVQKSIIIISNSAPVSEWIRARSYILHVLEPMYD